MLNFKKERQERLREPTLLKISAPSLRYGKSGNGPSLFFLHTIRSQLEHFQALAP